MPLPITIFKFPVMQELYIEKELFIKTHYGK